MRGEVEDHLFQTRLQNLGSYFISSKSYDNSNGGNFGIIIVKIDLSAPSLGREWREYGEERTSNNKLVGRFIVAACKRGYRGGPPLPKSLLMIRTEPLFDALQHLRSSNRYGFFAGVERGGLFFPLTCPCTSCLFEGGAHKSIFTILPLSWPSWYQKYLTLRLHNFLRGSGRHEFLFS